MAGKRSPLILFLGLSCLFAMSQNDKAVKTGESVAIGESLYAEYCLACHQADGGGAGNMNPPLIQTSFVLGDKSTLIKVLLNGMSQVEIDGESYYNVMPSFSYLTDADIAHVLTYVRNSFGNQAPGIAAEDVTKARKENGK